MAAVLLGNSTELATQPSKATDIIVMSKDSREQRSNAKQHSTLFETTDEKEVENLTVNSPRVSQSNSEQLTDFFFLQFMKEQAKRTKRGRMGTGKSGS